MEPFTIAALTAALGAGLKLVGGKLLEKGVIEPGLEPITNRLARIVRRPFRDVEQDAGLQAAVQAALASVAAPTDEGGFAAYALNLGFDMLQAPGNDAVRQEFARAALLMTTADPQLVPDGLLRLMRWTSERRPLVADLLFALRTQLPTTEWADLVTYSNEVSVQGILRGMSADLTRTADAAERSADYLRTLLADRGIAPDKPDGQALKEYFDYLVEAHSHLSFLFIKPEGRRRVRTEAELETVFVPLQVQDPETEEQQRRRQGTMRPDEGEAERIHPVPINEVLERYPVFLLKGLPGSGKTTLLRHVAVSFAQGLAVERLGWQGKPLLPILLPLRNFGRFLDDHRQEYTNPAPLALRRFIEDYCFEHEVTLPPDFFHQRLQEGGCLVLLDGLDEVADKNLRATVAQFISAFIKHYQPRGNRFGLASRPRGYDEVAGYLPRPVVCEVQPLAPESRDELVRHLLTVLEPSEHRRSERTRELVGDIRRKGKVDELSRNPLFCTTLVLVSVYKGATLPERRVDVYHELVDLLLGLWETHKAEREGVVDVQELVLVDGTGRAFMEEQDAREAKRRALTDLADWLQFEGKAEVRRQEAEAHLAAFFALREGAKVEEKDAWARNFLAVAHQRSGLFVEAQPDTYAFSHQNFREYLAAYALIGRLDADMRQAVLAHAHEAWWTDDVIPLALAHPELSAPRREWLLQEMIQAGHLLLVGRCAVDAGARLPAPLRSRIQDDLYARMTDSILTAKERYAAGEVLEELGWLPPDLDDWVLCPGCAERGGDLLVMKYPLTNHQFQRFIDAGGYDKPAYWGGEKNIAWRWRVQDHPNYRGKDPVTEPEYWRHPRFGRNRRGYPIVGVSWYEAAAYAAWLSDEVRQGNLELPIAGAGDGISQSASRDSRFSVRLPTELEWERLAGGTADKDRYPWDPPRGPATRKNESIVSRANVREAGIGGTSPVGTYPLGASQPFGLMDLAGNVWEWTASAERELRVLRGGSWNDDLDDARCGARWYSAFRSFNNLGFRLVSPIVSGS